MIHLTQQIHPFIFSLFFIIIFAQTGCDNISRKKIVLHLWEEKDTEKSSKKDFKPNLTAYLLKKSDTPTPSILFIPGGGYAHLAFKSSIECSALKWIESLNIPYFVLRYRCGEHGLHPAPIDDAKRAMRIIRSHIDEWHLDPKKIGVLGVSAGGHLSSTLGNNHDSGHAGSPDVFERASCKP